VEVSGLKVKNSIHLGKREVVLPYGMGTHNLVSIIVKADTGMNVEFWTCPKCGKYSLHVVESELSYVRFLRCCRCLQKWYLTDAGDLSWEDRQEIERENERIRRALDP